MATDYLAAEKQIAIAAVRRACVLTASVFNKLVKQETLTKDDKSPVTVGDFSAQAVVNMILKNTFPDDPIVGEEDAADLHVESGKALRERIVQLANETLTAELLPGEKEEWGLGVNNAQTTDVCGRSTPSTEQKASCAGSSTQSASRVELGVIGCPNLPVSASDPSGERGAIFVGVRGQGAYQLPLSNPLHSGSAGTKLTIPAYSPETFNFLQSVEKVHAKLSFNERVGQILGVARPPTRMDSQAKYCALARGDGGAYLRMPTGSGYREKIWDHAPGSVLVEEAGGIISDGRGRPLDFGLGRTLGENFGVVAAGKDVHAKVIEAVQKARTEEEGHSQL